MRRITTLFTLVMPFTCYLSFGQKSKPATTEAEKNNPFQSSTFSGLKFRSIGPALTSGRIVDLAVNPTKPSEY
jgi:hypothetical protein